MFFTHPDFVFIGKKEKSTAMQTSCSPKYYLSLPHNKNRMLKRLHIRNYALIDALEIDFSEQLTIITGETGAGKSILLGALGLVMGESADAKTFYNVAEKCVEEAQFEVAE